MYRTRLIKLGANLVRVDEIQPQDDLYEHLKYFSSKIGGVPGAITVKVKDGIPLLVHGLSYLKVAKELGYSPIQAIVSSDTPDDALNGLLLNKSVERVNVTELEAAELAAPLEDAWQLFYFERSLVPAEKEKFMQDVVAAFETLPSHFLTSTNERRVRCLQFSDLPSRAEFKAFVPIYDHEWLAKCVAKFRAFSVSAVRIVSYQGRRIAG
jgi:hypothetical protein